MASTDEKHIRPRQIDPRNETVFLLSDGPSTVGKSMSSLRRYIMQGIHRQKDPKEPKVYLASFEMPEGMATSTEAYNEFLIAINFDPAELESK